MRAYKGLVIKEPKQNWNMIICSDLDTSLKNETICHELIHIGAHYDKGNLIVNTNPEYEEVAERAGKIVLNIFEHFVRKDGAMTEIKVTGRQVFMDLDIPVVLGGFGEGKKCISDKTIAEIHNQPVPEIRRRITDNIKRFEIGRDALDLKVVHQTHDKIVMGESHDNLLLELGYTQMQISKAEHIYILSERGYAKLIKIMDTDLAWEVHDKLMDEYFALREEKVRMDNLSPELRLLINMEWSRNDKQ